MNDFWVRHMTGILVFLGVLLAIGVSNLRALRTLGAYPMPKVWPRVSVLLPARNEAANIGPCVRTLLTQDYPDLEILVLDDQSSDSMQEVLAPLVAIDRRVRVFEGQGVPQGWLGKHWACHQLTGEATGSLLLFADADTRFHPGALRDGVAALEAEKADLLSALPKQEMATWGERLLVPVLPWSVFSFLPLLIAHHVPMPRLSAAIGQFMLFRREAYAHVGGHAAIRDHAADDLALGWRVKSCGLRLRLIDGGSRVQCRMYRGFWEAVEGFSKNLFAAFDYRLFPFLLIWLWMAIVFLEPPIVAALGAIRLIQAQPALGQAAWATLAAMGLWLMACWRLRMPWWLALLYPLTLALAVIIAFRSAYLALLGQASWKGRTLIRPRLRLI